MKCEACDVIILLSEKDRHNERECEARTLNCKYCKITFNFKEIKVINTPTTGTVFSTAFTRSDAPDTGHSSSWNEKTLTRETCLFILQAHDEVCLKFPIQCKDCGKKKIPREKVSPCQSFIIITSSFHIVVWTHCVCSLLPPKVFGSAVHHPSPRFEKESSFGNSAAST